MNALSGCGSDNMGHVYIIHLKLYFAKPNRQNSCIGDGWNTKQIHWQEYCFAGGFYVFNYQLSRYPLNTSMHGKICNIGNYLYPSETVNVYVDYFSIIECEGVWLRSIALS